METVRYNYRAYPHRREAKRARRLLGCCRVAFNDAVREARACRERGEPYPGAAELQRRVLTLGKQRPDREWLGQACGVALIQAVRDADRAHRNLFASLRGERAGRRMGVPRLRSRGDHRQCARFTRAARFKIREKGYGRAEVLLPSIGWVAFVVSRPLPSDPSSVTLIHNADGSWHVSFVVQRPQREHHQTGRVAAIDVGLSSFATVLSVDADGQERVERIETPRFLRARQRALTRSQRSLARKRKGSRNRQKQRGRVARLHRRVADARLDHAHQTAARLSRDHDLVITEDYAASGATRSHKRLARSASDQGLGQFLRILREKRCEHQAVDRFFPSTQLCSDCGERTGPKGLDQLRVRHWVCSTCGATHDRDVNAARNLLREGLRLYALDADGRLESLNACELAAKPRPRRAGREHPVSGTRAGSTVGAPVALA